MKFRVRKTTDNLLYVQVKEGWFFWKNLKNDGDTILVHSVQQANEMAKAYFMHAKEQNRKDEVLSKFEIR
jgi:hypothetical protein